MTLDQYRKVARQIAGDLEAVFKKYGLEQKPFGARVDERLGIVRIALELRDVNQKGADGKATTPERERFKTDATWHGLRPEWLDREIALGGSRFTVDGLLKKGKRTVQIKRVADGKVFVTTPEDVVRHFASEGDADAKRQLDAMRKGGVLPFAYEKVA